MSLQLVDRRILGAVRLLDGTTGLALRDAFQIAAEGLRFTRNRSGYYVMSAAPGFEALQAYTESFAQTPATPDLESISVLLQIADPSGHYLPRRATLKLPRNPDSTTADAANSLFEPIDIRVYPSPIARTGSGWAVIRATVQEAGTHARLPWALIRVTRNHGTAESVLSQADWRGEALVAVPDIPVTTWEEQTVLATEVSVTLEVVFDANLQKLEAIVDGFTLVDPNRGYIPDPDDLNVRRNSLPAGSLAYQLASGRDRSDVLSVSLSSP